MSAGCRNSNPDIVIDNSFPGGMYSIGIDRKDRLWAVDSDNNRIFMLPLTNVTTTESRKGRSGGKHSQVGSPCVPSSPQTPFENL